MRFSLKELLTVAAAATLGVPALVYASDTILGLLLLLLLAMVIAMLTRAIILSGPQRAFAVGFLCTSLVYVAFLLSMKSASLSPYSGPVLTARAMKPAFEAIAKRRNFYTDQQGNRTYEPPKSGSINYGGGIVGGGGGFGGFGGGGGVAKGPVFTFHLRINQDTFMQVAQCLWTLLLGYLGGKYAVWVLARTKK